MLEGKEDFCPWCRLMLDKSDMLRKNIFEGWLLFGKACQRLSSPSVVLPPPSIKGGTMSLHCHVP